MSEIKKLFLLDAMALIYRSHFAFISNPRITSTGKNTSAIFGFTNTLLDILQKEKPSHIAVCYDPPTPTFRHLQYSEYKANRQEQPEDITQAIPYIKSISEAMGISGISVDGYEADDVIGTLALQAEKEGFTVYMMTPDKDFGQLVSENIYQYKPGYQGKPSEILDIELVKDKWNIDSPIQVIDILGLMGDSIDNIPGVPGIGEKTASKLIKTYGSIENILAKATEIGGKTGKTLLENKEKAIMSKELATIFTAVPINDTLDSLVQNEIDKEKLSEIFKELEFKTLGKRILGEPEVTATHSDEDAGPLFGSSAQATNEKSEKVEVRSDLKNIETSIKNYQLIQTHEELEKLFDKLKTETKISLDTETDSLDALNANLVGYSIAIENGEAWYIDVIGLSNEERNKNLNALKTFLSNHKILVIGQNIKYDAQVLRKYGVFITGEAFDTMLAHYLIEPDNRHNLDYLAEIYLQYKMVSIEELIGKKGKGQLKMSMLPSSKIKDYACEDADITYQLYQLFEKSLKESFVEKIFYDIEMPLLFVLADIEANGIKLDIETLKNYSLELEKEIKILERNIFELADFEFNLNSPIQLGEVLFDKLKLDPKAKRTSKSKQYSTNDEVLTKLAEKFEIAKKIQDYRSLLKLKSTYVDALPTLVNRDTNKIHTSFNQAVASTGRLSSSDPNLQNIPIRTDKGREIRKAFIPSEDNILLSADYSQIELRLLAEISEDKNLMQAFVDKLDIHSATASKIYHVPLESVNSEMRRKAKTVNFGIIYGISAFGLAQRLGISRTEAADIINKYKEQYPGIDKYMQTAIEFAKSKGYVETILGRRRYLRDINSANATIRNFAERNAINAPIQGSAADMIKLAMIKIHKRLKSENFASTMILQVHDELVFDVLPNELERLRALVVYEMENAIALKVPIVAETGVGNNWLEAH